MIHRGSNDAGVVLQFPEQPGKLMGVIVVVCFHS